MRIWLNGQEQIFNQPPTVAEVLVATGYSGRRVAVEVNQEIVPRSCHIEHRLAEGDRVEIVHALGGG